MSPMVRIFAQALLIRIERESGGSDVSPALLSQHAGLSRAALIMLRAARAGGHDPRVRLCLARLESGPVRSRRDVEAVARQAGVSARCLSRLVHLETRVPIQRHIQCRRLMNAAHLLGKTFLSAGEIAVLAGYKDESCLDRCFRVLLGVRPIELRSYGLRETCRAYMRGRDDALFARWVGYRLPMLVATGGFLAPTETARLWSTREAFDEQLGSREETPCMSPCASGARGRAPISDERQGPEVATPAPACS
jgi:AraC-like DNA-binding protein